MDGHDLVVIFFFEMNQETVFLDVPEVFEPKDFFLGRNQ